jgi:hypothetical protein
MLAACAIYVLMGMASGPRSPRLVDPSPWTLERRSRGGRDACLVEHGPHDLHVLVRARHHLAVELRRRRRRLLRVAAVRRHDA